MLKMHELPLEDLCEPKPQGLILDGVPKLAVTFEHHLAPIRPRVLSLKHHSIDDHDEANHAVRSNTERNPKVVILRGASAK